MSNSPREARAALARFLTRLEANLADASDRIVDVVTSEMGARVPKLSGGLAGSIEVDHAEAVRGLIVASVTIGEGLDSPGEAAAVEWGTSEMLPRPYWRPACNRGKSIAQHEMERAARSAL